MLVSASGDAPTKQKESRRDNEQRGRGRGRGGGRGRSRETIQERSIFEDGPMQRLNKSSGGSGKHICVPESEKK